MKYLKINHFLNSFFQKLEQTHPNFFFKLTSVKPH